ncbi:hypothetical protein CGLO_03816 [Colletotrichum gloeosporioides Cg-14]|uniref:Xylanolytic transcriptional activator regulatory domain-containing protein n=1 Tax=Colletotrichum gloeosporioides (strain Cg-14) TaxID=1237896 RepID=T0KU31_COLGC|nr:hypothetical protein CGLO_03816 [Colletotrichum gloeosporioides Cg-14]
MGEGGVEDLAIICAASTAQDDDWVAQEESHIGEAVAGDLASFPLPKTPADTSCPNASPPSLSGFLSSSNPPLPPDNEVIEGCRTFVTSYFQLGFIPKAMFQENLVRDPASTSRFLLCCILSISSRFTPSLVHRYGSATTATNHFLKAARALAPEEMYRPSLDNTQAFFLLAIAEWGNGDRDRSSMDMGVAVRMATLLKLHREETYTLPPDADAEQLVRAESARRTFWMIQSQENLHSGYSTPAPFSLDDITAYLPCDESDFAFGVVPATRSALPGTPPALANPALETGTSRCLFATLIQAHNLWGQVARRAGRPGLGSDDSGSHSAMIASLRSWEEEMPPRHKWSIWNLRGWKAESLHLAYLSVVMVLRLSNIVIRRIYIDQIIRALSSTTQDALSEEGQAPSEFWKNMSNELFANVVELHEQVEAYFSVRSRDEGFPAILVFCVYICGSLASYLWRHPQLCPHIAPSEAESMAIGSLKVLGELHEAWPTSARWQRGLQQIASPLSNTVSPVAGKDPSGAGLFARQDNSGLDAACNTIADGPADQFEAELAAFLNGDLHYDLLEGLGTSVGQFD